ncbi:MAG: zeta toxin family protein [Acidobacteriota bacterium]|nr:zeta toxin family protein [Acidobacteriota bacterium]
MPRIILLAGPNGAGKTTASRDLLSHGIPVDEFVNADVIAQGLSGIHPEHAALEAGRIMLDRLKQLAANRQSFAFETTLASRTFAPWIKGLIKEGYEFTLIFYWLPSAETAITRVRKRVRLGGHSVPDEVIRRRYRAGLSNFFELYRPLAHKWEFFDNSGYAGRPRRISVGRAGSPDVVFDVELWHEIIKAQVDNG